MARSFNGSSHYLTIVDQASLNITTAMTVMAWVYPTAWPGADSAYIHTIFTDEYLEPGSSSLVFRIGNGADAIKQRITASAGSVGSPGTSTTDLTLNVWQHVAITLDGVNLKYFLNGVADGSQAYSPGTTQVANNWSIGRCAGGVPGRYFQGYIAEVKYWTDIALNAQEIMAAMYNIGSPGHTFLKGWWPLWGLHSPEINLVSGAPSGTVTGAALANHAPVVPTSRRWWGSVIDAVAAAPPAAPPMLMMMGVG